MINIFPPTSTDQSVVYLGQIFGYVGNVLPVSVAASQILGTMFKAFNTIVLGIGALIVLYVTVVGVMKTAHEGEFMGKNWNNIWIPIRMVLGIAALVPSPSGYCAIQMVIMWIVLQGVGAADKVWDAVLNYTDLMGSPLSTITIPSVDTSNNIQNLFQGLVCQASAKQAYPLYNDREGGGYYCYNKGDNDKFCGMSPDASGMLNITDTASNPQLYKSIYLSPVSFSQDNTQQISFNQNNKEMPKFSKVNVYPMGPNGSCGRMSYCDSEWACSDTTTVNGQIQCNTCKAQKDVLQRTVNVLGEIANMFVQADYQFRMFYQASTPATDQAIVDYCNANNIPSDSCCRPLFPGNLPFMPPNQDACKFPFAVNAGDFNNASVPAVQTVYWPYYIKPALGDSENFIGSAANNYLSVITDAVLKTITNQPDTVPKNSKLADAKALGWVFAGAYYYYLADLNNKNVDASIPPFTVSAIDPKSDPDNLLYNMRNNYTAAGTLLTTPGSALNVGSSFDVDLPPKLNDLKKLSGGLDKSAQNIMEAFQKMVVGKGGAGQKAPNPLSQLQTLGKILLIIAQVLFALVMVVLPLLSWQGFFAPFVVGTGAYTGVGGAVQTLVILFAPLFALFMGSLFIFGGSIAIYVPMIPYIIFTMGAVGWFILIIEAMVAGPLVALGILSPSGHHEILGKSEAALMLIFGIFLRPTLMVFGMIAAMLMSMVVVTMINAGFVGVMGTIYAHPGLIEIIIFLGVYVGIILAALNKCFALIHIIPDRALRWIGGAPEDTGSTISEALSRAEGGGKAVAGEAQSTGKAQYGDAAKISGRRAEATKQRKQEEQAQKNANITPSGGSSGSSGEGGAGDKGGGKGKESPTKDSGKEVDLPKND